MSTPKHVKQELIITEGLQARAAISTETVNEYAEAIQNGKKFPPITVVFDGEDYFCADGIHRLLARRKLNEGKIHCDVIEGTRTDALRLALGANQEHGMRRTGTDIRNAIKMAYEHRQELFGHDVPAANMVAATVGTTDKTATDELRNFRGWADAQARMGADGKVRPVPTRPPSRPPAFPPVPTPPPCPPDGPDADDEPDSYEPPTPPPTRPPVRPVPTPPADPAKVVNKRNEFGYVDTLGKHVPVNLQPLWARRQEAQDMLTAISRIRSDVRRAQEGADPLYLGLNYSRVMAQFDQVYTELQAIKPYCVCPMCQGLGCKTCHDRGLIGQFGYEHHVPQEFRK